MSLEKFSNIDMSDEIRKSIDEIGYLEATNIQSQAIPLIQAGEDIIGLSQTGSGKTAAFGIPAIDLIDSSVDSRNVQVLILCPTRELALQSSDELRKFARYKKNINIVTVYGGDSIEKQMKNLRHNCQIVVGTPGRVMDHMRRKTISLNSVKLVILDEADEMLNMGFIEDIETILTDTPKERQTLLFSATMSKAVLKITERFQSSPKLIEIEDSQKTVSTIEQYYTRCPKGKKPDILYCFLEFYKPKVSIIFCNTKKMVDELVVKLNAFDFSAKALHGDMRQTERTRVINDFKSHRFSILVATDVAARGIDISDVEIVFNFDIPIEDEYFIHRTGRTGRAGKSGKAISFAHNANDVKQIRGLSKYINCVISELPVPTKETIKGNNVEILCDEIKEFITTKSEENYTDYIKQITDEGYDVLKLASAMFEMMMQQKTSFDNNVQEDLWDSIKKDNNDKDKIRSRYNPIDFVGTDLDVIRISVGRKDKISVNHILGAAAGETGLSGKTFGNIKIEDKYTLLEVPKEYKKHVIDKLNNSRIRGIKVKVF